MKKIFKSSLLALLFLSVISCTTDDNQVVVNTSTVPVFIAPESGTNIIINSNALTTTALTLVWDHTAYSVDTEIDYTVEMAAAGTNFANPITLPTSTSRVLTLTGEQLKNRITGAAPTGLGLSEEEDAMVEVRVTATIGDNADLPMVSEPLAFTVTFASAAVEEPTEEMQQLYIVGTATEFGFNNDADNTPLFRDAADAAIYHYTGYFNAGELKLLANTGAWQPQYGADGDGVLAVNDGTGSDPEAITVPAAGYYTFMVNLTDMTYSLEAYDASAATDYTSIGAIGSATPTGWDSDTDLMNTTGNPHIWHISGFEVMDGEMKFRADDDWTNSWGAATFPSGMGNNANDPNIPVTAGTYDVWFNDLDGRYLYIPAN